MKCCGQFWSLADAISSLGDKILIAAIAACAGWLFAKFRSEKK